MAFPWSPTGYHLDRLAFYIVADTLRLYADGDMVKVKPERRLLSDCRLRRRLMPGAD